MHGLQTLQLCQRFMCLRVRSGHTMGAIHITPHSIKNLRLHHVINIHNHEYVFERYVLGLPS